MRKFIALPLIALSLGATACGDDGRSGPTEPLTRNADVPTTKHNDDAVTAACREHGGVREIEALNEGRTKWTATTQIMVLCEDRTVVTVPVVVESAPQN